MNISHYFAFGLGLIAGLAGGYFVSKTVLEKHYQDELEEMVASFDEKSDKNAAVSEDSDHKIWEDKAMEALDKYRPNVTSVDLTADRLDKSSTGHNLRVEPEELHAADEGEVDSGFAGIEFSKNPDEAVLISLEEYVSDETRASCVINWYPGYHMATDEMDYNEVMDIEDMVNVNNLNEIVDSGAEIGYIRNGMINYEVHICDGTPSFME